MESQDRRWIEALQQQTVLEKSRFFFNFNACQYVVVDTQKKSVNLKVHIMRGSYYKLFRVFFLISDDIFFILKVELNHQIQIVLSQSYPVVCSSFYDVCFAGRWRLAGQTRICWTTWKTRKYPFWQIEYMQISSNTILLSLFISST